MRSRTTADDSSPLDLSDVGRAGRKPVVLTHEDLINLNRDHAVIVFHAQGVALVFTDAGERLTFTQFKRKHGTLGALWLAHPQRRTYLDYETWRLHHMQKSGIASKEVPGA